MDIETEIAAYFINNTLVNDPYILTESEELEIQRKNTIYETLTEKFPINESKAISRESRKHLGIENDPSLTYGEIEFKSLAEIFLSIKHRHGGLPEGGVFYDLGSGVGKALVSVALLGSFSECVGIEILESLHSLSEKLVEEYNQKFTSQILANPDLFTILPPLKSVKNDILKEDWTDASLILVNSTCFSDEMVRQISDQPLRVGTIGISITKPLSATSWAQLESVRKFLSWGEATIYIQKKIDPEEQDKLLKEFGRALDSE